MHPEEVQGIFGNSPLGWLLNLLFFPSGIFSLALILLFLKRSDFGKAEDEQEEKIVKPGHYKGRSGGKLRALRIEEIRVLINKHRIPRKRQQQLEEMGKIVAETCGYCMGTGCGGGYIGLPCGHYHHARCARSALEQDVSECADCGFCMKTLVI